MAECCVTLVIVVTLSGRLICILVLMCDVVRPTNIEGVTRLYFLLPYHILLAGN